MGAAFGTAEHSQLLAAQSAVTSPVCRAEAFPVVEQLLTALSAATPLAGARITDLGPAAVFMPAGRSRIPSSATTPPPRVGTFTVARVRRVTMSAVMTVAVI